MNICDTEWAEQNLELVINQLQDKVAKMQLSLNNIHEAVVWTSEDGTIEWCNTQFASLVNQSHVSILGNYLPELLPLIYKNQVILHHEYPIFKILKQQFLPTEYEFITSDKTQLLKISGSCLQLQNGHKTAVITIRDMTEHQQLQSAFTSANTTIATYSQEVNKLITAAIAVDNNTFVPEILDSVAVRADELGRLARIFTKMVQQIKTREQELAETNEQLEAIFNAVPGSISCVDAGGLYISVNRYLADNFQLSQDAFIGQKVGFLQGSTQMTEFMRNFIASSQTATSAIIDGYVNGNKRYYLVAVQKYQQGTATVSVGIDVTEQKQAEEGLRLAEEKYRSIFENALEGIFQCHLNGQFISVNPAMARIYGYDSPMEMINSIYEDNTEVYVDANCRLEFSRLMAENGSVKDLEYQIYRRDGSIIWVQENTRAVRDGDGQVLYYEGILQEISDRKNRENELKRQLAELKIEIDQKKREQEVALITKSDYFQELQREISDVNLDEFWQ